MTDNFDGLLDVRETEFDWFPENTESDGESFYQGIEDLKNSIMADTPEKSEIVEYEPEVLNSCDTEQLENRPTKAIGLAFFDVAERLGCTETDFSSEYLSDYVDELKKSCEVITTRLSDCSESELLSRVARCLEEGGCVVVLTDADLLSEDSTDASLFLDEGMFCAEIAQAYSSALHIKSHSDPQKELKLEAELLLRNNGVLLEVLK